MTSWAKPCELSHSTTIMSALKFHRRVPGRMLSTGRSREEYTMGLPSKCVS